MSAKEPITSAIALELSIRLTNCSTKSLVCAKQSKKCVFGHMKLLVDFLKKPWMSAKEPVLSAIA